MKVPKKWIRNPNDELAIKEGCWFDQTAADKVCHFFETFLCHSKGKWAGKPFILEPWQRDYLSRLYGWKRPNGFRRFRESHLEIPKKNGKSTLLSGICIYGLFEEPGAEVYCGAVDKNQAGIIFKEACNMVESSPYLSKHLQCIRSTKIIAFKANKAMFMAMSADVPSKDGANISTCVLDETHRYKNDELYRIVEHGGAARDQPMLVMITTSGHDKHSFCYKKHLYAKGVNEGTIKDTSFLGVIYGADPKKIDDPKEWARANPSWNTIIKPDEFGRAFAKAKDSYTEFNDFLRLRLNVWTDAETRWLDVSRWEKLARKYDPDHFDGASVFAHIDLSSTKDLTCLHLLFPLDDDEYYSVPYFFMPKETKLKRSKTDKVPYGEWVEDGYMIETEGNATNYRAIREKVYEISQKYRIEKLGMDPWNAQQLCSELREDGHDVVEYRQVIGNLSAPCKELERLILLEKIYNDGNPCMHWNVCNAKVKPNNMENIMLSKEITAERIDGVISLACALGLASVHKPQPTTQVLVFDFNKQS